MKRVYKYPVSLYGRTMVQMPVGSTILSVGVQTVDSKNRPVIWALVDPDEKQVTMRNLYVVMTGEQFEHADSDVFIGSSTTPQGIVFHVFEVTA